MEKKTGKVIFVYTFEALGIQNTGIQTAQAHPHSYCSDDCDDHAKR